MTEAPTFPFSCALIAGGTSRRMGTDKAFLEVDGQPLWEKQLSKLAPLDPDRLLISANRSQDFTLASSSGKAEILIDGQNETGPLAALVGCLAYTELPTLVLAVDMLGISTSFLRDEILSQTTPDRGVVFVRDGFAEPLAASYPTGVIPFAEEELDHGKGAFQPFIRACIEAGILLEASAACLPSTTFDSLNRPEDL